jgi:tetratricopeptide (TPR) repeat protein
MSSPHHSRGLAFLLSLVPGWGHVYLGRERVGLAIFSLTAASAFLLLNVVLIGRGGRTSLSWVAGAAVVLFWAFGIADVWRRTSPARLKRIEERKSAFLRSGIIAYLRDDLAAAQADFRACLKLDSQEPEALLRLGVVLSRQGAIRSARSFLRRARALDLEEKWRWEIERELESLREKAKVVRDRSQSPPGPEEKKGDHGAPAKGSTARTAS